MKNKLQLISFIILLGLISTVISDSGPGYHLLDFNREFANETSSLIKSISKNLTVPENSLLGNAAYKDASGTQTLNVPLTNKGVWYSLDIEIGTPPQKLGVLVDTGSPELIILETGANFCPDAGTFNPFNSSSYRCISPIFVEPFGSGVGAGQWMKDDVTVNGVTLNGLTMGLFSTTTPLMQRSILGLANEFYLNSITSGEHLLHRGYISALSDAGIIGARAYSIFLNGSDATHGSILFGGVDSNAYTGDLVSFPNLLEIVSYSTVQMGAITAHGITYPALIPAILDSGTAISIFPYVIVEPILISLGIFPLPIPTIIECFPPSDPRTIDFIFGSLVIKVKLSDFQVPYSDNNAILDNLTKDENKCIFGLVGSPFPFAILGDTFLKSAYVVYDFDNGQIAIAQANMSASAVDARIEPIVKGSFQIPGAKSCFKH